jgi:mono/diheme cytochrome c family protein
MLALAAETTALQEIMQGLRNNLAEIADGLLTDDFEQVARGATAIAEHPQIPPAEIQLVAATLGPEMPAFKQLDMRVHDLSLEIHAASKALDRDAAIAGYQQMLEGCLACHHSYKERVAAVLSQAPGR